MTVFLTRCSIGVVFVALMLGLVVSAFAQLDRHPQFGPPQKPLVKLIGFLDATPSSENVRPVFTLKLPGDEKRHTFLLTDMRFMAGPLQTPESILSAVKPYSTNFYIRASQEMTKQIASATPAEQLTILAEYSSADRALLIQNVEKSEEPSRW